MCVRNLMYDALHYVKQVGKIQKDYCDKNNVSVCIGQNIFKDEKLMPVFTIVLYLNSDRWIAPRSLKESSVEIPDELKCYYNDYKLLLLEPAILTDEEIENYKTDVGLLFGCLKYSDDKEKFYDYVMNNEGFKKLPEKSIDMIKEYTYKDINVELEGGYGDMSNAIKELIQDSREQGISIGREEGILTGRSEQRIESIIDMLEFGVDKDDILKKYDESEYQEAVRRMQEAVIS